MSREGGILGNTQNGDHEMMMRMVMKATMIIMIMMTMMMMMTRIVKIGES